MDINFLKPMLISSYGEMRPTQTRFTWVINQFGSTLHKYKTISSPVFTTTTDNVQTHWTLSLSPNGLCEEDKDFIGIAINCLNRPVVAKVEFSVMNIHGVKTHIVQPDPANNPVEFNIKTSWYICNQFLMRSEILEKLRRFYIQNDAIHIVCIISTNETIQNDNVRTREQQNCVEKLAEFSKFKSLLNDMTLSDVTLLIGNEEIKAHKVFLACSSSVFKAMFAHTMTEKDSSRVKIDDVDVNTMKAVLKFIYTAELEQFVSDKYNNYLKLLIAAEKYCIEKLKAKCQKVLIEELTINNALNCIVHADFHNAGDLKKAAIDFAAANADVIVHGPTFEDFMKCDTSISCEVVRVLVTKKRRLN